MLITGDKPVMGGDCHGFVPLWGGRGHTQAAGQETVILLLERIVLFVLFRISVLGMHMFTKFDDNR
jgi:hypothetical protein